MMNFNDKQLLDTAAAPANCHGYEELYKKLFTYGKSNWRFVQRTFDTFGVNSFSDYIAKYSQNPVGIITKQNRGENSFTAADELQLDLFFAGVSFMFRDWIAGKYKLTPKEAAKALYELTPATLREYWHQS